MVALCALRFRDGGPLPGGVDIVTDPVFLLVEDSQRGLEKCRWRRHRRHCCVQNIETAGVQMDRHKGAATVGIRDLKLMSFDPVFRKIDAEELLPVDVFHPALLESRT